MSEKTHIAGESAFAGGMLALFKLGIGLLTGSLALLSEGIHSSLDFGVTLVTWLSVKKADIPADREHHYGHGKIENLSAFAQAVLLVMTAFWIMKEAYYHLINQEKIDVSGWQWYAAVSVVGIAMIVDLSRSRALAKAAKKFNSQALEADALHFGTELISSAAVLISLLLVRFAGNGFWLADPIAAILVAAVMIFTGLRLGRRSADMLVDRAPEGIEEQVETLIRGVPGVHNVTRIRARQSGAIRFVDATITVDRSIGLSAGHQISDNVELRVTEHFPNMDILVHVEPAGEDVSQTSAIRELADAMKIKLHAIRIREIDNHLYVNFHAEFPPEMTLADAHKQVSALEDKIRIRLPTVAEIASHLEPLHAE